MYPCNYKTSFRHFFKGPFFSLPLKLAPVKLYMDGLISFSQYKDVIKVTPVNTTYYYPIPMVIHIRNKMCQKYIKKNKSKFQVYAFILILIIGTLFFNY